MALRNPPSWLQNGSHPAENDRLTMQAIFATTGVVGTNSLEITQSGSTPGLWVAMQSGWGAIVGDFTTNMGVYTVFNDDVVQVELTPANLSNPRIDLICLTVNDSFYAGTANNVTYQVITGTPAISPVAPSLPLNSLELAQIYVAAGAPSITLPDITDTRVYATTYLTGDISEVSGANGLAGGGTSGNVTLTLSDDTLTQLTCFLMGAM